jgi:fumarate reductase subunit C
MNTRGQVLLWVAQRASAAVLVLCVAVHIATMIYAVKNGLTAGEILGRTRGNAGWAAFYATFVAMVAVHGSIGVRAILEETLGWRDGRLNGTTLAIALVLAALGLRAVWAVFGGGA